MSAAPPERRSIVYLILCFGFPNELRDLFRILYHPTDHYILHCDTKAPPAVHGIVRQLAASFPNVHRIPDTLCSWGGYSLVDATLRGIDYALDAIPGWSHLALLSEQHLPVRSADAIAALLRPGLSRFAVERVRKMEPDRRELVFQRFAYTYRELPGVGCFPLRRADMFNDLLDRLHHGSQWVTLAREACERLRRRHDHPDLLARLRASMISDETCIHTLLGGTQLGVGLDVRAWDATYVAWPALNFRRDLIFIDDNFTEARQKNYLFIRKRPPVLTEPVQHIVDGIAGLTAAELDARLVPRDDPKPAPDATDLAADIVARLKSHRPRLVVVTPPTDGNWMPRVFLRVRTPPMHPDIFVAVLSEDLRNFKVQLLWRRPGPRIDAPLTANGYPTLVQQIRITTLMHQREILLPASDDQGFVTLDAGDLKPLIRMTVAYLAVADTIRLKEGKDY